MKNWFSSDEERKRRRQPQNRCCADRKLRSLREPPRAQSALILHRNWSFCQSGNTTSNRLALSVRGEGLTAHNRISNRLALSVPGEGFAAPNCISNRFWPKNRSHRKQTIKPRLTGARMHIRETAFSTNFQISAAAFNEELQLHREAPRTLSQSSNISRSHGRP